MAEPKVVRRSTFTPGRDSRNPSEPVLARDIGEPYVAPSVYGFVNDNVNPLADIRQDKPDGKPKTLTGYSQRFWGTILSYILMCEIFINRSPLDIQYLRII